MRYEFHPEAEMDLYEAASRYESEVPEIGLRFGDEVERVIMFGGREFKTANKAMESAPVGRPTRKSEALLLAAHR